MGLKSGIAILAMLLGGCFYPPQQRPVPRTRTQVVLDLPYYRAWEAVHKVIERNEFRVITEDPDQGTIEAQAVGGFSLADADCGRLTGIAGKYDAQPDVDSSAIYDFHVKPRGNEAASVDVQGTFTSPLHVPLHPPRGEQCVSRGSQEARLLAEISRQAADEHRSGFEPSPTPFPARQTVQ